MARPSFGGISKFLIVDKKIFAVEQIAVLPGKSAIGLKPHYFKPPVVYLVATGYFTNLIEIQNRFFAIITYLPARLLCGFCLGSDLYCPFKTAIVEELCGVLAFRPTLMLLTFIQLFTVCCNIL